MVSLVARGHPAVDPGQVQRGQQHHALRDLALRSRGAYTFIDNDEILPVATGDLISGLREEAVRGAALTVPEGWACAELDGGANTF